jgi:hypothetical protein
MASKNALRADKKLAWTAGWAMELSTVRDAGVSGWSRHIYCKNGNFLQQNCRARHLLFYLLTVCGFMSVLAVLGRRYCSGSYVINSVLVSIRPHAWLWIGAHEADNLGCDALVRKTVSKIPGVARYTLCH